MIFDATCCKLGEGPLWHPERNELFWFDILGKTLLTKRDKHQFNEHVSAAGWIDSDTLLIASETALLRYDTNSRTQEILHPLEADNKITRSNDGRADPWGGFWIGTMGKNAEPDAGAIYRYFQGELRQLFAPITIPNAICFSPNRQYGYFTDTSNPIIWRQKLHEKDGWPTGYPENFIDFNGTGINPDGAVIDADGNFWNAQWGAARVAQYSASGAFLQSFDLPTSQITCPAFGGDTLQTLFVTSATQGLRPKQPDAGKTFALQTETTGQKEHQIAL